MTLICGSSDINFLWKNSDTFTSKDVQLIGMENILNLSHQGVSFCQADNSGRGPRAHPQSQVAPENRLWFHVHTAAATFMSGIHLKQLVESFQNLVTARVENLSWDDCEKEPVDLYQFVYDMIFPAQLETLFGPEFLTLNPGFVRDFRVFHKSLAYFLRGYPQWVIPKAWAARERCFESVKKWHRFIQQEAVEDSARGSPYIRNLRGRYEKMESLDRNAVASSELGIIWA